MRNSNWLILGIIAIAGLGAYLFFDRKEKANLEKAQEENLKYLRNNWSSFIAVKQTQYIYSQLGGIRPFDIPVQNNTDYFLDEVIASVEYIKADGGTYKTEKIVVANIPPHSIKTSRAPESVRGISVKINITEAISRSLHLCYPLGNQSFDDPFYCQ